MIFLVAASAIGLLGTQATIAAPTTAFRTCLREATAKATTEKVTGDGIVERRAHRISDEEWNVAQGGRLGCRHDG